MAPEPDTSREELRRAAETGFSEAFGRDPSHASWAPGRVNIIGEHVDYNAGLALPIAIDSGCVCVGRIGESGRDRMVALDLGKRYGFEADEDEPGWSQYVTGVLTLMRERLGGMGHVDLAFTSSVPMGSGLSSSAALEVATATLAEALSGARLEMLEKARLCQRAEHEFAGVPCGLMDQLVSVAAEAGRAMLIDFRSESWDQTPAPPPGALLVIDSGVRHELGASEYASRRAACDDAVRILGIQSLRDATPAHASDRRLSHEQRRCVRHVTTEIERVRLAETALKRGDLVDLGRLMVDSHASLRDDYRVSCRELDAIVDAAVATSGIHGARMTGGGFGGSAIALGEPEAIKALAGREIAGSRARFVVSAADGARVL